MKLRGSALHNTSLSLMLACTATLSACPSADDDDSVDMPDPDLVICTDVDGDGHIDDRCAGGDDCDDRNPDVHPGAIEVCANGLDDDCDGACVGCGLCGEHPLAWADAKLLGEGEDNHAGRWVAPAGDIDNDGFHDILVSADRVTPDGPRRSYVIAGPIAGTVSLSSAAIHLDSNDEDQMAGNWNISSGDLNGDGERDFVAAGYGGPFTGVVYGPQSGAVDFAEHVLLGTPDGLVTNTAGSVVGDVDGDGMHDLLVGFGEAGEGVVLLYSGPVVADAEGGGATAVLLGGAGNLGAGKAVSAGGDINADGYDDLLISDPYYAAEGDEAGAVHVVYGPVSGELSLDDSDALLLGRECWWYDDSLGEFFGSESRFGHSIGAADLNADGLSDVIVGAPGAALRRSDGECEFPEGATSPPGMVYIFFGPVEGDLDVSMADAALSGLDGNDQIGWSVSTAGDTNGDGLGDIVIGARGMNEPGSNAAGGAFLATGPIVGPMFLDPPAVRLVGETAQDGAGWSVSGGGDINADGYTDIVVGAIGDDAAAPSAGAAYVLYGGPGW